MFFWGDGCFWLDDPLLRIDVTFAPRPSLAGGDPLHPPFACGWLFLAKVVDDSPVSAISGHRFHPIPDTARHRHGHHQIRDLEISGYRPMGNDLTRKSSRAQAKTLAKTCTGKDIPSHCQWADIRDLAFQLWSMADFHPPCVLLGCADMARFCPPFHSDANVTRTRPNQKLRAPVRYPRESGLGVLKLGLM